MDPSQGWFIQTNEGRSFLIIIKENGSYVGLRSAVKFSSIFYAIEITNLHGKERDLISMITKDDEVNLVDLEWETEQVRERRPIDYLVKYRVVDKNGKTMFSSEEVRFFSDRIYKI